MSATHYDRSEVFLRLPLERLMVKLGLFEQEPASGNYPCPIHNETNGNSFSLDVEKGVWNCFGACASGGTGIDLLMRDGASFKEAIARYAEYAGMTGTATPYHAPRRKAPKVQLEKSSRFDNLPAIPEEVAKAWDFGIKYLQTHADARELLSEWRCWPLHWMEPLVERGEIGMPICYDKRAVAFPVRDPQREFRMIGLHARLAPRNEGERPGWVYLPNGNTGQKTPSLPFIMGAESFSTARLLVILGGQWDAITFAGAAGWLDDGRQWPDGVCVIAPRGDSGTKVFLDAYRPIWPTGCNILLFPDGDASGNTWTDGQTSFANQLKDRGCRVAVVMTAPHKDFNDLYRSQKVTPANIAALLASHGMEVAK